MWIICDSGEQSSVRWSWVFCRVYGLPYLRQNKIDEKWRMEGME